MATYKYQYEIKQFKIQLSKVSDCDIAWFSGWLCADGCIAKQNNNLNTCRVAFHITDRDPLERFAKLFGGKVTGPYTSRKGSKPMYVWATSGAKAVLLLKRCVPWLSLRYKKRATHAMQYAYRGNSDSNFTPSDVKNIKLILDNGRHGVGRKLAQHYNVSDSMISQIRRGSWNAYL